MQQHNYKKMYVVSEEEFKRLQHVVLHQQQQESKIEEEPAVIPTATVVPEVHAEKHTCPTCKESFKSKYERRVHFKKKHMTSPFTTR